MRCFVDSGFPLKVTVTHSDDLPTFEKSGMKMRCMCVTPDGRHVVTGWNSGDVIVWELESDKKHQWSLGGSVLSV